MEDSAGAARGTLPVGVTLVLDWIGVTAERVLGRECSFTRPTMRGTSTTVEIGLAQGGVGGSWSLTSPGSPGRGGRVEMAGRARELRRVRGGCTLCPEITPSIRKQAGAMWVVRTTLRSAVDWRRFVRIFTNNNNNLRRGTSSYVNHLGVWFSYCDYRSDQGTWTHRSDGASRQGKGVCAARGARRTSTLCLLSTKGLRSATADHWSSVPVLGEMSHTRAVLS